MIKQGKKTVDTIFVHCSATRPDWMENEPLSAKVAEITRWHIKRGFSTGGYHYYIDRDGSLAVGRPETVVGAHAQGHNEGSIGICLLGGHGSSENDPFEKNFTPEQDMKLRELIGQIEARTPIKAVRGHNEVAAKACPGFSVKRWLENRTAKASLTESSTMQASAAQILSGGAGGVTAIAALDGYAQIVAVLVCGVIILTAAWIMRERIRKWAREHSS